MKKVQTFHGVAIEPGEGAILEEIENILGAHFSNGPISDDISPRLRFRHKDGHVVALDLTNNELTCLPPSIHLLKNLEDLTIHRNKLERLPDTFTQLKSLRFLWLDGNRITNLPSEIGNIALLEVLNLSRNQLQHVPSSLGQIPPLRYLNLDFNQIQELPPEFGELPNIHKLLLRGNHLTNLPNSFAHLSRLGVLDIRENNNISIPDPAAQRLASLELSGSIILGAPYPSPFGHRTYTTNRHHTINSEEELRLVLEKCRKEGEDLGEEEEPNYIDIASPNDDYLQLGFAGNEVLVDYDALYQNATAGCVPYERAVEVAMEFFRYGRLSTKVDWHV